MAGVTAWKSMYWMPITCWKYYGIWRLLCNYWMVFNSGLVTRHSCSHSEHTWIQISAVLILSLIQTARLKAGRCLTWAFLPVCPFFLTLLTPLQRGFLAAPFYLLSVRHQSLLSAVSLASLALFQGCAPQGGDAAVVLARALPACTVQQECIDLLP